MSAASLRLRRAQSRKDLPRNLKEAVGRADVAGCWPIGTPRDEVRVIELRDIGISQEAMPFGDRFDPFAPGFQQDPYPVYRHWRDTDPVHWGHAPDQSGPGCWYIFTYAEAKEVLADPRFVVDPTSVIPADYLPTPHPGHLPLYEMLGRWFIFRDPPDHTRLRHKVSQAFDRFALDRLQPQIDAIASDLCRKIGRASQADLISDLALALPQRVIARILGLPDSDAPRLHDWSVALLKGLDFTTKDRFFEMRAIGAQAAGALAAYLDRQLDRAQTGDGAGLLAMLAPEVVNDPDLRQEVIATAALLIFAGHETTVNLIGNGFAALLDDPEQVARLRRDTSLRGPAIEECARYDSPSQITFRFASQRCAFRGKVIEPGSPVGVVIASANRDGEVFEDPDRFDIGRSRNPHLSYGRGIHACIGAALARREARAALDALLMHCPNITLSPGPRQWAETIGLRGLRRLDVRPAGGAISS